MARAFSLWFWFSIPFPGAFVPGWYEAALLAPPRDLRPPTSVLHSPSRLAKLLAFMALVKSFTLYGTYQIAYSWTGRGQ